MKKIFMAGSDANKFETVALHLSRKERTVHVELTGSDENGDGSRDKPFATFARALSEATGTTRILTITLGDGEHDTNSITVSGHMLIVNGTGSLRINATTYYLAAMLRYGYIYFDVNVIDVSQEAYTVAFSVYEHAQIQTRKDVTLTNAGALILSSQGQNSCYFINGNISSVNAISKIATTTNTEPLSVKETSVTYNNIT